MPVHIAIVCVQRIVDSYLCFVMLIEGCDLLGDCLFDVFDHRLHFFQLRRAERVIRAIEGDIYLVGKLLLGSLLDVGEVVKPAQQVFLQEIGSILQDFVVRSDR